MVTGIDLCQSWINLKSIAELLNCDALLLFHDAFVTAFVTAFVFPRNSSILAEVEFEYLKKDEGLLIYFDVITRKHHKKKSHVFLLNGDIFHNWL